MNNLLRQLISSRLMLRALFILTVTTLLALALASPFVALAGPDAVGP